MNQNPFNKAAFEAAYQDLQAFLLEIETNVQLTDTQKIQMKGAKTSIKNLKNIWKDIYGK